jgi:hypothetical protein
MPIEVKYRRKISEDDLLGIRLFQKRFTPPIAVIVTRDLTQWSPLGRILCVPLQTFLLLF